jgi:hypothetical protein
VRALSNLPGHEATKSGFVHIAVPERRDEGGHGTFETFAHVAHDKIRAMIYAK